MPKKNNSDSELIPDILAQKPVQVDSTDTVIIVDGCPIVDSSKSERLKNVLLKKFSTIGEIVYTHVPFDSSKNTTGYMFIGYETAELAAKAVKEMNNVALDKSHTFIVTLLTDYDQAINVTDEWIPPVKKTYTDIGNLRGWLLNEFCRDQFALLEKNGDECSIYWHTPSEAIPIEQRADWSEGWIHWSPHGTYLATMHPQGVILWGGDKFQRVGRFAHKEVRMLDFSPLERFMVTLSPCPSADDRPQGGSMVDMIIWDVRKGTACRNFAGSVDSWPTFKWSHDDAYVATLQNGKVFIYDTETFKTLDKKPLGVNIDISDFSWSPTDNIIAYWVAEVANAPARVTLVSIPSRKELCAKNLFSVAEISLIWHPQGDFLAVQVLRCNKKKVDSDKQIKYMGTFVNFEIVRMREKLYPVDQLEVKDAVSCFQWEPHGSRFAYVTTNTNGAIAVPIYELTKNGKVREISVLPRETSRINDLRWSPKGNIFVVANLKSADANIEFIDANDCQSLAKVEHAMASELLWDSTGRYLASVVSSFAQKSDNAVWFWSCVGRPLHQMAVTGLRIFTWRPFPPTLLSAEQIQAIKKSLTAKYSAQFENEDKMLASKASRELMEKRQSTMADFISWRTKLISRHDTDAPKRVALRGIDTEKTVDAEDAVEELEFLVKTSQEAVVFES